LKYEKAIKAAIAIISTRKVPKAKILILFNNNTNKWETVTNKKYKQIISINFRKRYTNIGIKPQNRITGSLLK
jgi:hypothetical protein